MIYIRILILVPFFMFKIFPTAHPIHEFSEKTVGCVEKNEGSHLPNHVQSNWKYLDFDHRFGSGMEIKSCCPMRIFKKGIYWWYGEIQSRWYQKAQKSFTQIWKCKFHLFYFYRVGLKSPISLKKEPVHSGKYSRVP